MKTKKDAALYDSLAVLVILFLALAVLIAVPFSGVAKATFYENTSITTKLNVSNAAPTVHDTEIYDNDTASGTSSSIILNEGDWDLVFCNATARDTNGWGDINKSNASIFLEGNYQGTADRDLVYYNSSCLIEQNGTDAYSAKLSCSFKVFFHADPGAWNCSIYVWDNASVEAHDFSDNLTNISQLYALELNVTEIDYGVLNVTDISGEQAVNIKNTGNADINVSVDGYGNLDGDGVAMNCSGSTSIPLNYERYGIVSGLNFTLNMTNLTDSPLSTGITNLTIIETDDQTQNSTNNTYWKIYVPIGVQSGECNGTIVFSAVAN